MEKYKRLNFARSIFTFIIFVIFGIIICTEKGGHLLIPKIQEKINEYLTTNYKNILDKTIQNEITYKNRKFTMKITDTSNENHYFYITYSNGKITDTYKNDYQKGESILKEIANNLEKEINNKTNFNAKVNILASLDNYTTKVQELILSGENLINSKIYSLSLDIDLKPWNGINAAIVITNTLNTFKENNITPKSYTITIHNLDEITDSIEIYNIKDNFINNINKEKILDDIISNTNSDLVKESKITFKHLN